MDVVHVGADFVGVLEILEGIEQFHVRMAGLDRDHVGVHIGNGRDDADWGVQALERAAQGLSCTIAEHICYGYGIKVNTDWKSTLGDEWRQYEAVFPALAKSRIDQVSLECIHSHVPPDLMQLLVGVIDVDSDVVETPEEVADTIGRALQFVPKERLFPCTNCGLAPMVRDVA